MVRKSIVFLVLAIAFLMMFVFFLPKKNIVYLAQRELQHSNIIFDFRSLKEKSYSVDMEDMTFYIDGVDLFTCKKVSLQTYLFYNKMEMQDIVLSDLAKEFLPLHVKQLQISYALYNPLKPVFFANGEFGEVKGFADLLKRKVFVVVYPSQYMKTHYQKSMRYLYHTQKGEFVYEYSY